VSAYLAVLADETILKVTRETLQSQTASYDLTKRSLDAAPPLRWRSGKPPQPSIPPKQTSQRIRARRRRTATLSVLLIGARLPDDISFEADLGTVNLSADLPAGVPSESPGQRPDVLAAEHTLIAANADIGAARAAFFLEHYPDRQLRSASTQLSGLFKRARRVDLSPQIAFPYSPGREQGQSGSEQDRKEHQHRPSTRTPADAFRESMTPWRPPDIGMTS